MNEAVSKAIMKNYLKEIMKRRDLLFYLVKSELKAENRNSYLGYFWWLLDPLLNVLVYYFLVGIILGRGGENFGVFLVIGLVAWRWMNTTITTSAKSITKYRSIINQVNLPKSIFPLSFTLTQLVNYLFGLIVIAIFLAFSGTVPGWQVVYLPLIILVQLLFLTGFSLFIAYITVFVRDIDNILSHIMRLFFYASPIIWEGGRLLGKIPEGLNFLIFSNPVAIIITSYRDILMDHQNPQFLGLFIIAVLSIAFIIIMLRHYHRNEHKIIKAL